MGDSSGQENHTPTDDIRADDSAGDARQYTGGESIGQIAVLEQVAEKSHHPFR